MIDGYALKTKSDALERFKALLTLQGNLTGNVKFLRTDNGLEFCSKEFDDLYQKKGITRHFTVANAPQKMV